MNKNALEKLNAKLMHIYKGKVTAEQKENCVLLSGKLTNWNDIVKAGQLAAKTKEWTGVLNDIELIGTEIPKMKLPQIKDHAIDDEKPDVLVIGAGVVGCAIARELKKYDLSVLIVDKENDVALHASSRNDGMIHPGIDLKKGTNKKKYNQAGNAMYEKICAELGVKFERTGQYLCFKERTLRLPARIVQIGCLLKGIPCKLVRKKKLHASVEGLRDDILYALLFSSAGAVCPYGLTIAYAENAVENGAKLSLNTVVTAMELENNEIISVSTNRGKIYPKVVVNAAGVFCEEIAKMANDRHFSIHPRKGTNAILDKKVYAKLHDIVSTMSALKTKGKNTKGGGIVKTVDGNILVGPDAYETFEKENFATESKSIQNSLLRHEKTSVHIKGADIITYFTGVRASTYEEDFYIAKGKSTNNIVHAAGVQSPGLTAAPAIAVEVAIMAAQIVATTRMVGENPSYNPNRKPIPKLSEMSDEKRNELIKLNPDYGEIICRCEEISKGEIIDALNRNISCTTLDGIKRRVRPGMGRCQGGFCSPLITKIIAKQCGIDICDVTKNGKGSNIVFGSTKEVQSEE